MATTSMIRVEVGECLSQCEVSQTPLDTLAAFLNDLRLHGWNEADLHEVERPVMRVLARLMAKADS